MQLNLHCNLYSHGPMAGLERLLGPMANAVLGHRRSFEKERGDQVVQVNKIWT